MSFSSSAVHELCPWVNVYAEFQFSSLFFLLELACKCNFAVTEVIGYLAGNPCGIRLGLAMGCTFQM